MKQWFSIAVIQDGIREGTELIKAESIEDAKNILIEDWANYPYVDDVEAYELLSEPLTTEQEKECAHKDVVELFQTDGCTKVEAESHIKNGSAAVKVADWAQFAEDNDLRNEDGERLTLDEIRSERDVHSVTLNGEEYLLLYVL